MDSRKHVLDRLDRFSLFASHSHVTSTQSDRQAGRPHYIWHLS